MGGRVRNLAILEALAPHFDLEIVTLVHDRRRLSDPGPVARMGRWIPVMAPNRRSPVHRVLGQIAYRIAGSGWERETWFLGSPALARAVGERLRTRPPAIVHAAYWFTLRHLRNRPRPPLWVLDTHDVQFERWSRLRGRINEIERDGEIAELARNDVVVAITPHDAAVFRSAVPAEVRIETIGMGVDLDRWSRGAIGSPPRGEAVGYYGYMANESNSRAAIHLCTEILPELRALRPAAEVVVIGADPAPEVVRLARIPGVRVTGTLDDPRQALAACGVLALPLRASSGIRSRACEVMGLEVPIVAYPEALEGMEFEPDREYLAAADPRAFARQIHRVLTDPTLASRLATAARAQTAGRYGIEATYGRFVALYRGMIENPRETRKGPEGAPRGPSR